MATFTKEALVGHLDSMSSLLDDPGSACSLLLEGNLCYTLLEEETLSGVTGSFKLISKGK